MANGKALLALFEAKKRLENEKNNIKNGFKELNPEAYSDEKHFEDNNKSLQSEVIRLIKKKLY